MFFKMKISRIPLKACFQLNLICQTVLAVHKVLEKTGNKNIC